MLNSYAFFGSPVNEQSFHGKTWSDDHQRCASTLSTPAFTAGSSAIELPRLFRWNALEDHDADHLAVAFYRPGGPQLARAMEFVHIMLMLGQPHYAFLRRGGIPGRPARQQQNRLHAHVFRRIRMLPVQPEILVADARRRAPSVDIDGVPVFAHCGILAAMRCASWIDLRLHHEDATDRRRIVFERPGGRQNTRRRPSCGCSPCERSGCARLPPSRSVCAPDPGGERRRSKYSSILVQGRQPRGLSQRKRAAFIFYLYCRRARYDEETHVQEAHSPCESRRLSVQAESKVVGPGARRRAALAG